MDRMLETWDADRLRRLRSNIRAWSKKPTRDLPWRHATDPYRVWVSEIMLQQTTVTAVVGYYERFIQRFPTVEALASASEQDVLLHWEGLGYYSRARNLHRAAQEVVQENGGQLPDDVDRLQQLPGIGRYTAGAIASFAFGRKAPIVEANTLRLYARLLGYEGDPRSGEGNRLLWEFAERILPRQSCGHFNQALMDLGATICTPVSPACCGCPLKSCCQAFASGLQDEIPKRSARMQPVKLTEAAVAVRRGDDYLLRRCEQGERWAGLWDFPRVSIAARDEASGDSFRPRRGRSESDHLPSPLRQELEQSVQVQTGAICEIGTVITEIRHTVTHHRIRLICCGARYRCGRLKRSNRSIRWVRAHRLAEFPLPVTGRKLATLLSNGNH